MRRVAIVMSILWVAVPPSAASAQTAPAPITSSDQPSLRLGWEARRDRHTYRFENPSSFDAAGIVPHVYQQDYDADNLWVIVSGRYRGAGRWWDTEVGLAWWGKGVGRDYDTFFQPGGDVVVYGTTADTDLASIRFRQLVELGDGAGIRARVGYAYRRDASVFAASDSIIRHSSPPSETRFFNADRETTVSELHEVQFGLTRRIAGSRSWSAALAIDATPVTLARLTTRLPDKYPGRDIVGIAKGFSLAPALSASWSGGLVHVAVSVDYAHTWPYGSTSRFTRNWFGASVLVGISDR